MQIGDWSTQALAKCALSTAGINETRPGFEPESAGGFIYSENLSPKDMDLIN